jgi:hypothetical protein
MVSQKLKPANDADRLAFDWSFYTWLIIGLPEFWPCFSRKKANPSAAYGVVCESSVSFFASVFATRRHHLEQTVRTHDLIGRRVFCF